MTTLTQEHVQFLERQGIPFSQVFDATGLKKSEYKTQMDALGLSVAIGVTPCAASGHTMRSKAGHCVQCGTHHLAFQKRYAETGTIYIAASKQLGLTKVGTSQNLESRIHNLRSYGYGGANDWTVIHAVTMPKAARFEFHVHRALSETRKVRSYIKDGFRVDCQELFECSPEMALKCLNDQIVANLD